jgi:thioredoxin 1
VQHKRHTEICIMTIPATISEPATTLVFVSASGCMPCVLLKPIARKIALEFAAHVTWDEIDGDIDHDFCSQHGIDSYPQLLLFRNNELKARMSGFGDATASRAWLVEALQGDLPDQARTAGPQQEPAWADTAFTDAIDRANASVMAIMQEARDRLHPFMSAIEPDIAALDARLAGELASGVLSEADAARMRRTEQTRLQAPFQDSIDALRTAQARALEQYERIAEAGLIAYRQSTDVARRRLECSPDGSICRVVD